MLRGTMQLFYRDGNKIVPRVISNGTTSLLSERYDRGNRTSPNYEQKYFYNNTSVQLHDSGDYKGKGIENNHRLFEEQLLELEEERTSLFGKKLGVESDADPLSTIGRNSHGKSDLNWEERLDEMNMNRESLYDFTQEEKDSWVDVTEKSNTHSASLMEAIKKAREERNSHESERKHKSHDETINRLDVSRNKSGDDDIETRVNNTHFTHLSPSGDKIAMVDVGTKDITKRVARAQSVVIFPPEVMEAFGLKGYEEQNKGNLYKDELIGPKGPIFATAQLAGIMGAKRTSDLIPLCHPLTLDNVCVDIKLGKVSYLILSMI